MGGDKEPVWGLSGGTWTRTVGPAWGPNGGTWLPSDLAWNYSIPFRPFLLNAPGSSEREPKVYGPEQGGYRNGGPPYRNRVLQ